MWPHGVLLRSLSLVHHHRMTFTPITLSVNANLRSTLKFFHQRTYTLLSSCRTKGSNVDSHLHELVFVSDFPPHLLLDHKLANVILHLVASLYYSKELHCIVIDEVHVFLNYCT